MALRESVCAVIECQKFGWADKSEIERIKEQTNPFAAEIGQLYGRKLMICIVFCPIVRVNFKMGSLLAYSHRHQFDLSVKLESWSITNYGISVLY